MASEKGATQQQMSRATGLRQRMNCLSSALGSDPHTQLAIKAYCSRTYYVSGLLCQLCA